MTGYEENHPKVFISYSHDSPTHARRVLELSNRLREHGIDCHTDLDEKSPPEGLPRWMVNQIEESDYVLLVCTEAYQLRFRGKAPDGEGKGADWEGAIITQELYEAKSKTDKFIPVLLYPASEQYIPIVLRAQTHYDVTTQVGYDKLFWRLMGEPETARPALGSARLPVREPKQWFFARFWNVPHIASSFFTGRATILENLRKSLTGGAASFSAQLEVVSGFGGVGKTQTALAYAYRHRKDYEAILWLRAASRDTLFSDFAAIAGVLDLPEKNEKDQNVIVEAAKQWLESNGGWLLVFDNADDPALLKDFLPHNPEGHAIATSRAGDFQALGITKPVTMKQMPEDDAVAFLLKRTGRDDRDPKDRQAAKELAVELGYLPLAMEQAGAYICAVRCHLHDYVTQYRRKRLALLEKKRPISGEYSESVATTWLMNFEEVEEASRAAADILRFSAFLSPDAIPFELLTKGAPELGPNISSSLRDADNNPLTLLEELEPLTRYSLINLDPDTDTYSIHLMVQEVLKAGMDEEGQRVWAERMVGALNHAFPQPEYRNYGLCERLTPHAKLGARLVETSKLNSVAASLLLHNAGWYLTNRACFAEAEPLIRLSLSIVERIVGPRHRLAGAVLTNLATVRLEQGHYAEAGSLFEQAFEIIEQSPGEGNRDMGAAAHNLATLYTSQGRYADAERLYKRCLRLYEESLDPDAPEFAATLNGLGELYHNQGKLDEARLLYEQALAIREQALDADHPDLAESLNNLAELCRDTGLYNQALALYQRARDIWESALGPEHPNVGAVLGNLALLYDDQGNLSSAETFYRQSLDIRVKTQGSDHPATAVVAANLAALYRQQARYDEAGPLFEWSLSVSEKVLGPEHPQTANVLVNYACLMRDLGRHAEADEMESRAAAIRAKHAKKNPSNG